MKLVCALVSFSAAIMTVTSQGMVMQKTMLEALTSYTKNNGSIIIGLAAADSPTLNVIKNSKNLTLFLPTNEAVSKLDKVVLDSLSNKHIVHDVLFYHAIAGLNFIPNGDANLFVKTALGPEINVVVSGSSVTLKHGTANGAAKVIDTIMTSNGVVHVVDTVLLPPQTVTQSAVSAKLDGLVGLVKAANLASVIDNLKDVTIFAPTNDAVNELLSSLKSANITLTTSQLQGVLALHVLPGVFHSTDIVKLAPVTLDVKTYAGENIYVESDKTAVFVAGKGNKVASSVVIADVLASTGVIHVIDHVLLPSDEVLKKLAGVASVNVRQLESQSPSVASKDILVKPAATTTSVKTTTATPTGGASSSASMTMLVSAVICAVTVMLF